MSFYSKISLLALMAAGNALGMELPPRLKAPATSAAAQALIEPMIKIYSDNHHIDTIQRNYLEASKTLKNMLEDVEANQELVLPDSMIEDYKEVRDLFSLEHRLKIGTIDEKAVRVILKRKTVYDLSKIANACLRFDLPRIEYQTIKVLAKKICNETDFIKKTSTTLPLPWTQDVARLVAQAMLRKEKQMHHMLLTELTDRKDGGVSYWHVSQKNGNRTRIESSLSSFEALFKNYLFFHLIKNASFFVFEPPAIKPSYDWISMGLSKVPFERLLTCTHTSETERSIIYWEINAEVLKMFETLKPEEVLILSIYYKEKKPLPIHLQKQLPEQIRNLLFPSWWQRRSWLSKAALITGGVAATGLAAWLGYKYFSKK